MLKPINEYIVLKQDIEEKKLGKLLLVTENEKKKANVGIVVACSKTKEDFNVKVGDKVIYRDYAVTEFVDGSEKFFLVQEEDVLAIIE